MDPSLVTELSAAAELTWDLKQKVHATLSDDQVQEERVLLGVVHSSPLFQANSQPGGRSHKVGFLFLIYL